MREAGILGDRGGKNPITFIVRVPWFPILIYASRLAFMPYLAMTYGTPREVYVNQAIENKILAILTRRICYLKKTYSDCNREQSTPFVMNIHFYILSLH